MDSTKSSSESFKWSPSKVGKPRSEPTQWNFSLSVLDMQNVKPAQVEEKATGQAILRIFE